MLDQYVRAIIDTPLNKIAKGLVKFGVTANTLTLIGFLLALPAFAALAFENYIVAIIFIILSRLMDGLDGPVARQTIASDVGGFLDIVSDFIFYAGCIFFFAVGRPENALPAAFLLFSFMGTASAFLAYAIFAAKRGVNHERQGKKSFYYASGLTEGTETIFVLILVCLLPNDFSVIAYTYAAMCWVTTLGRAGQAVQDFK
jgi:phosphatidylglycerophosphate synthase